jgi:predicted NUDIX family phosphoesterase
MTREDVFVFPRKLLDGLPKFVGWPDILSLLSDIEARGSWLPRDKAEVSSDLIQLIPAGLLRSSDGRFLILRRIKDTRGDLRSRLTLVVGGHINPADQGDGLLALVSRTLEREILEELAIAEVLLSEPVGLVIDNLSVAASRHAAVVHVAQTTGTISIRAKEEFSSRSSYSGRLMAPPELLHVQNNLDPWSLVVFQDFIAPFSGIEVARQASLGIIV